ncbi:MAG: M14 family zinc carboxypeptidase [Flavobacteriales bacterium]|nr:M14 family zinc carboxypeptidase [Flavobacteriales bacterium]
MIHTFLKATLLLVASLALAPTPAVHAQLQSPAEFLGYELGDRFTRHHQVVDYMEHLAASSDLAIWSSYGLTSELRTLGTLVLSTPGNLARLEDLRQANLARVRTGRAVKDIGIAAPDDMAIVWLSYNVHGNEAVCTEAAMATAYALATASHRLENAVVIIDPCVNPDGRDRYVAFQDRTTGPMELVDLNPDGLEHNEPWPGGRSNHFLFDMNRDWAWQTQIESEQRVSAYRRWMPHVHVDFHEMGVNSPYYFAPAAEPLHSAITPWQRRCQEHIGQNNARYFDQRGALYFTREVFDLFYPSYGDTWPMFHGAIGMTYEQGGSSRAGRAIRTDLGEPLTLAYRIENHLEAGLSTIEESASRAAELVSEFTGYHAANLSGERAPFGSYLIPASNDPERKLWLTDLLDKNGIAYGSAPAASGLTGYDYSTGRRASKLRATPDDLIIDGHQSDAAFLHVLFDPDPVLSDSLTYDITAWAVPHAYGLSCYGLDQHLSPTTGASADGNRTKASRVSSPESTGDLPYAWVAHGPTDASTRALAALLKGGVVVRIADSAFRLEGSSYPAGAMVITRRNNEDVPRLRWLVAATAAATAVEFTAVSTGLVDAGHDLGSDHYTALTAPRIATLQGPGSSSLSSGEIWHRFDTYLAYPLTRVESLDDLDLEDFDVLIMPSGWYGLDDEQRDDLADWVRSGGHLVAIAGALGSFAGKKGWGLDRHEGSDEGRKSAPNEHDAHALAASGIDAIPHADRRRARLRHDLPGAVYAAAVDPTHPLAFGYNDRYLSLKTSGSAFAPLNSGNAMVLHKEGDPFSGHAGSEVASRIAGSLVAGAHRMGRGSVVYLADNPLFRAFWRNGHRLFDNAVFLGPAF